MNDDWLKDLKPGSEVAVSCGLGGRDTVIAKIARITPSGRFVLSGKNDAIFNPDGGQRGGVQYYEMQLMELTPKVREGIECARLRARLSHIDWGKVEPAKLRRIDAILKELKA